jgi:hypothetical protein
MGGRLQYGTCYLPESKNQGQAAYSMVDNLAQSSAVQDASPPNIAFSLLNYPQKLAESEGINSRAARVSALEPSAIFYSQRLEVGEK